MVLRVTMAAVILLCTAIIMTVIVLIAVLLWHLMCYRSTTYRRGDTSTSMVLNLFSIGWKGWPLGVVKCMAAAFATTTKKGPPPPLHIITAAAGAGITTSLSTLHTNGIMIKIVIKRMTIIVNNNIGLLHTDSFGCELSLLNSFLAVEICHVFFWLVIIVVVVNRAVVVALVDVAAIII